MQLFLRTAYHCQHNTSNRGPTGQAQQSKLNCLCSALSALQRSHLGFSVRTRASG